MTVRMQVVGFQEFDKALAELPVAFQRNVLLSALKKAGQPIVRGARARARRGTDPTKRGSKKQRRSGESAKIGHAADSIAARVRPAAPGAAASIGIGPDVKHWYLMFEEFGTSRQAPHPVLRPAFAENAEEALGLLGDELWKSLARTTRRLARTAAAGKLSASARKALTS